MKKLVLLILIVVTTQFSFANDDIGSSVMGSFNKDFCKATDVQWQHAEGYDMASFVLDNRSMSAYYTPDGELLAVVRNIVSLELPLKLLLDLKKNYGDMWISGLFEMVSGSDDEYCITLENADEQLILKAKANKSWKVYKKIVKI